MRVGAIVNWACALADPLIGHVLAFRNFALALEGTNNFTFGQARNHLRRGQQAGCAELCRAINIAAPNSLGDENCALRQAYDCNLRIFSGQDRTAVRYFVTMRPLR
jgi:hypothetical protein